MHKNRRAFTLIELLVVIAIIAVLMAILVPALKRAKEQGKRAACISNIKQLTLAWIMYCDDNDDRIVNGAAGIDRPGEKAWAGKCWADNYGSGGQLSEAEQAAQIQVGALWPYVKELKLYRCPTGSRGELLTYAAMDGVAGLARTGTTKPGCFLKKRTEIKGSQANRIVYIDEGWVTPDSFAVHYTIEQWWDDPPTRHGDGTNQGYADGHAAYFKWTGIDTIKIARNSDRGHSSNNTPPTTDEGKKDLHFIQKGCWGSLGYTPTVW